jgi:DNA repair protein RecN (Recombination protein N)
MLKHLSIKNYAIIESIELDFKEGFTVITGETGAGKSILLGALSLILGNRVDVSVLNNKEKKCVIEGEFLFKKDKFSSFFNEYDFDLEPINIIRREINVNGKSRAFINDTPVSLNVLRILTSQLLDIHSQNQTLELKDSKFQISVVDAFAGLGEMLAEYSVEFSEYSINKKSLNDLITLSNNAKTDIDYIQFQVQEIEELALKPKEKEKIELELEIINNAENIKTVLENSSKSLMNSDGDLLLKLKNISNSFSEISSCSDDYNSVYTRLSSVVIELEDLANEIEGLNNNLSFDTKNAHFLTDRLSKIYSIEKKHNLFSSEQIIELFESLNLQLSDSNSYEEKIIDLKEIVSRQKEGLLSKAKVLSKSRRENFKGLIGEIVNNLKLLGMPDAMFNLKHDVLDEVNETGIDEIEFLFTSNKGVDLKKLSNVASGGELSRLMLTIKSILANNNSLSSVVFDEIDTGVSGDIADKMATIMKKMSKNMQVIAITHLPQVAAKGETHYRIYKENKSGKTLTSLSVLTKKTRVEELAKMLSGEKLSSAAIDNAKILLKN